MPPRSHTEITLALQALAFNAGDYKAALVDLEKQGVIVVEDTLKGWATETHLEQYESIQEKTKELYEQQAIVNMRSRIGEADAAEKLAIKRAVDTILGTDNPKEAAQAAYYLSNVKKNNIEKMRLMQDKSTEIIEDRTPDQALRSLMSRGILKPVEEKE